VRLALSVENLTDERYYTHAFSLFEVCQTCREPGAHR
jgi:outer membrane receptor protein involved in Fe transport